MSTTGKAPGRRFGRAAVTLLAVGGLVLAGCGDDDDDTAATGDEQASETQPDGAGADLAAFCESAIEGESVFNAGPELDEEGNPTPEGMEAFAGELEPLLADLEENAPAEVQEEVEAVVGAVRTALETGDPSATESPEMFEADAAIDSYVFENCELDNRVEITAVDYGYEDVPDTLPAGQNGVRMDNQGEELHEAVFLRILDEERTIDELLELPEEEAQQLTEFVGVAFAPPGERSAAVMDLEAGNYAVICFIPVGTTSLESAEETDGPPHFARGMVTELTVE